jgi:hypothetical protein
MSNTTPNRFWAIRHPSSGSPKKTVAQFDTQREVKIPDEIANYDEFVIEEVSGRSALVDSVDQSALSETEKELLSQVYPIQE